MLEDALGTRREARYLSRSAGGWGLLCAGKHHVKSQQGIKYKFGKRGPRRFFCGGLTVERSDSESGVPGSSLGWDATKGEGGCERASRARSSSRKLELRFTQLQP